MNIDPSTNPSPWHRGEQTMQSTIGIKESLEEIGKRVIRSYMPDQHRDFFNKLPFIVVGSVDIQGWPWASILTGYPGFISSPTSTSLTIRAQSLANDPLRHNLSYGSQLGLLGIEITSRRRNRVNARVSDGNPDEIQLDIEQSFGNCPQYIQKRSVDFVRAPDDNAPNRTASRFTGLDLSAQELIATADTFFVASYVTTEGGSTIDGVDVSHRGGKPGFVKVEGNRLTIPDYSGNNFFNTLGNFLENPKAGLLFVDFESGNTLQVCGSVELLLEKSNEISAFKGAERGWRVTVEQCIRTSDALPLRAKLQEYSPHSLITGTWQQSAATVLAEENREVWQKYKVVKTRDESSVIRSFSLQPSDGAALVDFKAGQHLTIRTKDSVSSTTLVRNYTVSSAPGDTAFRISVKREDTGTLSPHLHSSLQLGTEIDILAPRGGFVFDPQEKRPAVLIAAGVGITPMISMAEDAANELVRARYQRELTVIHAASSSTERAFYDEFTSLAAESQGQLRYISLLKHVTSTERIGTDYSSTARIDADLLRCWLSLTDYDFYLCGPAAFMQEVYDTLREIGVRNKRIFAESFGPAALTRDCDIPTHEPPLIAEADSAQVRFACTGTEHTWSKGEETLLGFAERHDIEAPFSCRSGSCGSCATKLNAGAVAYRTQPTASIEPGEVLLCCAVPAQNSPPIELDL